MPNLQIILWVAVPFVAVSCDSTKIENWKVTLSWWEVCLWKCYTATQNCQNLHTNLGIQEENNWWNGRYMKIIFILGDKIGLCIVGSMYLLFSNLDIVNCDYQGLQ